MKLIEPIVAATDEIKALRRQIHAHPELSFEEVMTADLVCQKLTEWGIPFERGLGKTGVVGIIKGQEGKGAIGLRADMDALPMDEINKFAHASKHQGKMHACGHDGHTAMLLGAAKHLAKHRNFAGTVYLVFQPAEEGGGGAARMMEDGLFEKYPMDAIFGAHNWPGRAAGTAGTRSGPFMASSNEFDLVIKAKGTHAALPHLGVDPVMVAVQIVQAWQTIVSRNKKPIDTAVLSVTQIHVGSASNIIAESAEVSGTVRTFTTEVLDMVEKRMLEIAQHTAAAFGATVEFNFNRSYPPTVNHPYESAFLSGVLVDVLGANNVDADLEPVMGAEDFGFFLQAKPGNYFFLGNGDGEHREMGHGLGPCSLHNGSYDFNDELLPIGASVWVRLVEKWFAEHQK